jgi:hypothetical protein
MLSIGARPRQYRPAGSSAPLRRLAQLRHRIDHDPGVFLRRTMIHLDLTQPQ